MKNNLLLLGGLAAVVFFLIKNKPVGAEDTFSPAVEPFTNDFSSSNSSSDSSSTAPTERTGHTDHKQRTRSAPKPLTQADVDAFNKQTDDLYATTGQKSPGKWILVTNADGTQDTIWQASG